MIELDRTHIMIMCLVVLPLPPCFPFKILCYFWQGGPSVLANARWLPKGRALMDGKQEKGRTFESFCGPPRRGKILSFAPKQTSQKSHLKNCWIYWDKIGGACLRAVGGPSNDCGLSNRTILARRSSPIME